MPNTEVKWRVTRTIRFNAANVSGDTKDQAERQELSGEFNTNQAVNIAAANS